MINNDFRYKIKKFEDLLPGALVILLTLFGGLIAILKKKQKISKSNKP
jgi:hypothetical protein